MTREEALQRIVDNNFAGEYGFDMQILINCMVVAREIILNSQFPSEDCISREEVNKLILSMFYELGDDIYAGLIRAEVNKLPSVQPKSIECEDCISRAEAQKHIYRRLWESALNNVGYECKAEDVFMDIADNRLSTWISELPSIQPKPKTGQWILVSERLPDVGDEYLVTVRERWGKDEEWEYETDGAYYTSGWEISYDIDEGQEWEVIAWMPLPEPYRAESEGEE